MTIHEIACLLDQVRWESSTKKKRELLQNNKCDELSAVLRFLYDSAVTTGLDEKKLNKVLDFTNSVLEDASLTEALDYIKTHNTGRDQDVAAVQYFIGMNTYEAIDAYFMQKLFTKTLKVGIDTKAANAAFPGLIYKHEVQQGYPIEKYPVKDGTYFYLSEKVNGIRCTFLCGNPISRQGKRIDGIDYLCEDIRSLGYGDWFVDGELRRDNFDHVSDNENFRMTAALVNSKEAIKPGLKFIVFDMFPMEQLKNGQSDWTYKQRKEAMVELRERLTPSDRIEVVDFLYEGTNQAVIEPLLARMDSENKEGMMLNLDVPYMCKRHRGCLKIKTFKTVDLEVVGIEEGDGNFTGTLGAFVVKYKNNTVRVGSGFTKEQRDEFWKKGFKQIGKIIEVKYKEESLDSKTGLPSLQFPIFVCVRTDKKEESYN